MRLKQCIFALMAMLLCAFSANAQGGSVAKIGDTTYATLSAAFAAVTDDAQTVVVLQDVTEELTGAYLRGNITTENGAKVTINLTNSDWVYCPYTFVLGENITLNLPALFYYAGGAQINGAVITEAYYQRNAGTKLTINEPGSLTVTSEMFYIRYTDNDANAGIYVNGDNNDETVGLNLSVAYFYQGMIYAKDANIKTSVYWQTNETDGQGSANLVLDNSTLNVTGSELNAKATGNSTVTLTNGSSIVIAGAFETGSNTEVSVDATSSIQDANGPVVIPVAKVGDTTYATLAEAVSAAQADQTVTLLADINMSEILVLDKAITLDGNGKKLTSTASRAINVSGADGVTINNLTINASGERAINVIQNATNVTIDGVTATAANYTVNVAASAPNAVVAINNSTLNGLCTVSVSAAGAGVTIEGSTVNCNDNNTTVGEAYAALSLNKEAVGGSIVATNTTVNVTDGSDSMKGRNSAENGTVSINGSTDDVTVMVAAITYEGSTYYYSFETLAAAVEYAKAGDVVTLIRDVEANEVILIDKSLTIEGNGHKVTSSATRVFRVTTANTEVTLNDVKMVSTAVRVGDNDVRGISIDIVDNVKLTLNNSSVDFTDASANDWAYAVNVTGGNNHVVTVNGGTYEGANVINVNGANNNITVKDAVITCTYPNNDLYYGACIYVKQDQNSSVAATGNTFNGSNAIAFNLGTGTALTESDNTDNTKFIVAKIGAEYYTSLADAFAIGGEVKVLQDIVLTETVTIPAGKAITLDLNGKKVTSTAKKAFEVHADATIKNGAIEAAQRCVDTRTAVELTLTDVELVATSTTYGNPQPLTIGGSDNGTQVTMENVEINAGTSGYGIITFVKTELTATNSTIGGFSALYVKPGSDNSEFNFVNSDLSGGNIGNDVDGNSFSTIAVRANNVAVNVDAESTVTANGDHYFAISFIGTSENTTTGSSVTVAGEITGNILDTPNGNTVKVKAEYADELAAAGYDALPDLNGNYVVGVKPTATVNNLGMITVAAGEYSIYNGNSFDQNTKDDGDMPLSFVMQFLANQTAADMATSPYADWYGDFVITFTGIENGSFTADGCYLAGHYGSFGWVKVPVDGMTIEEGARYPVMLGVGLGQKYDYICSSVQDFKCALYLTPEILEANPNIEVKLELAVVDNSKGGEAAKSALINNENVYSVTEYTYKAEDFVADVELPEVEITDIKDSLTDSDPDLTFALNFAIKDVENLTDEYLEKLFAQYGDWYTDYVLTISGLTDENVTFNANGNADGYLAGQYDAWSENWVSVPFEDVTLKNDSSIYIMEYAAKLMGKQGLRFTLAEVAEIVQNFDCGVYFTPEFLAANPGMKVDLQLKVFTEDAEGNKVNNIDVATNNFEVKDYVAIVHATGKQTTYCTTLADAVAAATEGTTITMLRDVELAEDVTIPAGKVVTLDLNGKTVRQSKECTDSYAMITNDGSLTITGKGKLSFTDTSAGDPSFGWGSYTINNRGTLVVENGTIEHLGTQDFATHMICAIFQYSGSTTINGGIISTPSYRSARLWKGDMTINGGEFDGQLWVQAVDDSAKLTINGGTFAPNGRDASSVFVGNVDNQDRLHNVEFAVTDGTFTTKIGCSNAAEIAGDGIKGGKFTESAMNNTNSALLAEGFVFADEVVDGYYGIVADPNYIAEFIIDDAARLDYDNDTDKTVGTLTYKRTLAEGAWNPLYLPFQVDVAQLADNYDIAYYNQMLSSDSNNDGAFDSYIMEVAYITSGTLNANYPYFIRPKTSDDCYLEYVANDVTLFAAKDTVIVTSSVANIFKLHGTHKTVSAADLAGCYTIKASGWVQTTIDLRPHRLYLEILENDNSPFISAAAKSIRIVVRGEDDEDGTTGIDGIYGDENGETVIFDLYGRRVLEPEKGNIYIINGKKVLVK